MSALEGLDDPHVSEIALRALTDADAGLVVAALGVLRGWVQQETGTRLFEAVTAIAVDRMRDPRVRIAALETLSDLPEHLVRPIREQAPRPEAAGPPLDDPAAAREWVEALPDVIRITSYVRTRGAGRKLAFVANRATDEGSLPALADEEQVPIAATIPDLPAFDAAGDRGVPAWTDDAEVEEVLQPLASAVWSLFPGVPTSSEHPFGGLGSAVRRLLGARGDRR